MHNRYYTVTFLNSLCGKLIAKHGSRVHQPSGLPQTIGRVYSACSVHPSQGESFYLRLLFITESEQAQKVLMTFTL